MAYDFYAKRTMVRREGVEISPPDHTPRYRKRARKSLADFNYLG
ncbi:hypothetical protein BH11ACT2_BH11ACT2_02740 [soil metagenome]